MTEDLQSRRSVFKSKWSKIRKSSGEDNRGFAFTNDVSEFLQGGQKSPPPTSPPLVHSTRPFPAPRIDVSVARRWPDAAQVRQGSGEENKVPSPLPVGLGGKPKRRKGLTVRFSPAHPEIIGYGGDETETPPIQISQARAYLARSQSERRPEETSFHADWPTGGPLPHRPGIGDRSRTGNANIDAHSNLISAGVFGDRPRSRDGRLDNDQGEHASSTLHRAPTTHHSPNLGTAYSNEDEYAQLQRGLSYPQRKPVSPYWVQQPFKEVDAPKDQGLPSQERVQSQDRLPRALRDDEQDGMVKAQQRMRNEEGRAFSQAYRLSQVLDMDPDDSPVLTQGSLGLQNAKNAPDANALNIQQLQIDETQPSVSTPMKATFPAADEKFLHPSIEIPEHITPPVTPPLGSTRSGGLAPQDYLEYSKAQPRSRSGSATVPPPRREVSDASRDSPQYSQQPFPQDAGLKVDVSPASLGTSQHDPASQISRSGTVVHNRNFAPDDAPASPPIPSVTTMPRQSPPSTIREKPDNGESALSQAQKLAKGNVSIPQTPVRRVDPMAAKAFDDFSARVNQMKGVFKLTAQKERSDNITPSQWLRCGFWWLRRAKMELEKLYRTTQRGLLTQAHVNMAKAWWILTDIIESGQGLSDPRDAEDESTFRYHLESLLVWMDKHQLMPPHAALIQGQDTAIWISYASFSPDIEYLLGASFQSPAARDVLPLGDSKQYFFYQTILVNATVVTDDPHMDRFKIPCSLSIVRHWTHYRASVIVASQNGLVNVLVGPPIGREKTGPTWYDIAWRPKSCAMNIALPRGVALSVSMDEADYRSLSTMIEYTRAMDRSFQPAEGETLIYSSPVREAQYSDKAKKQSFPEGSVKRAFIGVFESVSTEIHANWKQKVHRGYRVMLITPSTSRTLGAISHKFDPDTPFLFEVPDPPSDNSHPAVIIQTPDVSSSWRMLLVFESLKAFNDLLDLMHGTFKGPDEYTKSKLALRSFNVSHPGHRAGDKANNLESLKWQEAVIIDRRSARPSTILSESLRIVLSHSNGAIVDRFNLPPGAFLMRLPISRDAAVTLARRPQADFVSCIDRRGIAPSTLASHLQSTKGWSDAATLRTYSFTSLSDLHTFQEILTGYTVACDVSPTRFAITRSTLR